MNLLLAFVVCTQHVVCLSSIPFSSFVLYTYDSRALFSLLSKVCIDVATSHSHIWQSKWMLLAQGVKSNLENDIINMHLLVPPDVHSEVVQCMYSVSHEKLMFSTLTRSTKYNSHLKVFTAKLSSVYSRQFMKN